MTGTEVREIRQRLGMTQTQLAEKLGVSATTIYRWETGRSPISQLAMLALGKLDRDMARDWVLNIINGTGEAR